MIVSTKFQKLDDALLCKFHESKVWKSWLKPWLEKEINDHKEALVQSAEKDEQHRGAIAALQATIQHIERSAAEAREQQGEAGPVAEDD
jgi:hypothetical protein